MTKHAKANNTRLQEDRTARMRALNKALTRLFPEVHVALHYTTPWELLVAVILSAQCTDVRVNMVTKTLFKKYPTLVSYVHADPETFAQDIRSTGFYKNKAKNILASAKKIYETYKGEVPCGMDALISLPGVARKTANVVLSEVCGKVEGIVVDTHVKRFAIRFQLTDHTDPVKIERDLMQLLPKKEWRDFSLRVIEYGRTIAPARKYDTSKDPLVAIFPPAGERFRV